MNIPKFDMILKKKEMITPRVGLFTFNTVENNSLSFTPGQFITVQFECDGKILNRSYTISSPPNSQKIELAVTFIPNGPGTKYLFDLNVNDQVKVIGPFGRFTLTEHTPNQLLLIGTSTGVAPYRSMIPILKDKLRNSSTKIFVLQGVSSQEELLFVKDFVALDQEFPNFQFHVSYSRKMPSDSKPYEHSGYVQKTLQNIPLNPDSDIVYLCGNPSMIEDINQYLQYIGLNHENIRFEKYYAKPKQPIPNKS